MKRFIIALLLCSTLLISCGRVRDNKVVEDVTVIKIDGDIIYVQTDNGDIYSFYGDNFYEDDVISVVFENNCIVDVVSK